MSYRRRAGLNNRGGGLWSSLLLLAALCFPFDEARSAQTTDEAWVLGLRLSDGLLSDPIIVKRIEIDLMLLRRNYPEFEKLHVYRPYRLGAVTFVTDSVDVRDKLASGDSEAFELLKVNSARLTSIRQLHGSRSRFDSTNPMTQKSLQNCSMARFQASSAVLPDECVGDCGHIRSPALGSYYIRYGWGDCPSGCIYNHFWRFSINGQIVTLLEEGGDPLPDAD